MSCVLFWLWRRVVGGVRECSVDGVGGAALRAEPTHPAPVGCFVPRFVWVFVASRDYLPSPIAGALVKG